MPGNLIRYQPFKTLYLAYFAFIFLFFRLPYYIALSLFPWTRPRSSWTARRAILVRSLQDIVPVVFDTASFDVARIDPHSFSKIRDEVGLVWIDAKPELVVGEIKEMAERNKVDVENVAGYWYGKRDSETGRAGQRAGPDEKVMYALHAGGFVIGSAAPTGGSAGMYKDLLHELPQFSRLFALQYRLSDGPPLPIKNPVPAHLIDAIIGYDYLINELGFKPSNILVLGDSAGGTLTAQLAKYIASSDLPNISQPGGLLLLSPSMDWGETHTHSESTMLRHRSTDWIVPFNDGYCSRAMLGYLPWSVAQTNWYFSPASLALPEKKGTFRGFPPTMFLVGGAEMTLDGMKTAYGMMVEDLGEEEVTWVELEDATHIVLSLPWHEEEKSEAYRAVRKWADTLF
ncbi:alpha/beta-hydrolase [Irpex rosettiformis]|uniref:Alpha/beta-hydrolase n=1 Tax=Irpex rosettiformis TaxID=378272 RepID=A0ACB8U3A5_9APHY|nr:alpha/beta-hydrolase [Irpex rosettiformis]